MKTAPLENSRQRSELSRQRALLDNNTSALPALRSARPAAFTLIELLVVIGIIVLLAALTFPALQAVKASQARTRARAELAQIETAIETYKTKLGFYPPDNTNNWIVNPLYYELMGTTLTTINGQPAYQTLDGSASIFNTTAAFQAAFGGSPPNVTGFMNTAKPGAGDDSPNAVKFLTGLKDGQFLAITNGTSTAPICTLLGVSMTGPTVFAGAGKGEIVPYGYNSSSPQHNPKSFDLWVDILAGGKTNRISNWSSRPIFISTTAYP
jgi:prepilin-type N-terminal cleavage/methylation domain-containing protein